MKRLLPAVGLFLLAPLVSEYLLGDLPLKMIGALVVLAPLYGGGALLVRESVRRTGRGWASILLLALAFGILEEAFMTQSLFNPNYLNLNLHLLVPGYIPALGIGLWWTFYVLTLHTVWSISASIGLMEGLVPARRTEPWLGNVGLTIVAVLFLAAGAGITFFSIKSDSQHFVASKAQLLVTTIPLIAVIVAAFSLQKDVPTGEPGRVPTPWFTGLLAFLLCSAFFVVPNRWGVRAVVVYIALYAGAIVIFTSLARRSGWSDLHRLSLAAGAALTYAWHSFLQTPPVAGAAANRIGNAIFALGAITVIAIGARKTSRYLLQRRNDRDALNDRQEATLKSV